MTSVENEVWKEIEGSNGDYLISNKGRVYSNISHRNLSTYDSWGYRKVHLTTMGKGEYVHRLVATAFIENPNNKKEVNHKDHNRANNDISNLEWVTSSENSRHAVYDDSLIAWGNKATPVCSISPLGERKYFRTMSEAERYYNSTHIVDVLKGRRNTVKGFRFEYAKGGDVNANTSYIKA